MYFETFSSSLKHNFIFPKVLKSLLTKLVLNRFHDSSRVVLLICLNLHSALKAEKARVNMRKCSNCYFLQYKCNFFAVQMILFWCVGKKFWLHSTNFCRKFAVFWSKFLPLLMVRVLPPFGGSFAAFWWEFCRLMWKFLTRSTKVCCRFLGGGV